MKKEIVILILGLLILPLFLNGLNSANESLGLNPEQIEETTTKITTLLGRTGEEWKTLFLENSFVRGMDSFFQNISPVFFVLFAEEYLFSLKLLLIVVLWIYLVFALYNIFKNFSTFSKLVSFGISFILVGAMAHLKILELPVNGLIWLFFGEKEWWVKLIIGVIIFFILVAIFIFIKKFGKQFKANRQKKKDEMNSAKLDSQVKATAPISDALSKVGQK